ncbi:MAG: cytochrome c3 family protein, partial [Deltaproteobacteria bacterium]|nr:cytochrome c3 family protein [Deltaproteobacteria bacterium]
TIQATVEEALEAGDYEERLESIEEKLDVILEYHKKSLSARITDEEIEKGKQLFEGEIPFTDNIPACVTCHNTYEIDSLNWNPSAFDIATAFSQRNDADIANLIINPISDKMRAVLDGHRLTDDETFYITAYLQTIERNGLKEHKTLPVRLIIFLGLCLVVIVSFFDLLFTNFIKRKIVNIIIILGAVILISNILFINARNVGLSQNYAPDQPIKFSHLIHVKENNIDCLFCHNSPEFSRESGVPTTNVCMICHNKIKTGTLTGQFEIKKIVESFEKNKPIEWVKIHNLPDHVFFSHAQHVSVGKIECRTCHGDIEEMNVTRQYATLSMGWCVQCHRETKVQFEDNKYYSEHNELHDELNRGTIKMVTADKIGANDCQTCHY